MSDRHEKNAISYRPPADGEIRSWLYDHAKRTGRAVNAVITEALSNLRADLSRDTEKEAGQ